MNHGGHGEHGGWGEEREGKWLVVFAVVIALLAVAAGKWVERWGG